MTMALSKIIFFLAFLSFAFNFYGLDGRSLERNGEPTVKSKDPAVKIVKTVYGDEYDCVDIYKQPAFDHQAAPGHKIEMDFVRELEAQLRGKLKSTKSYNSIFDPKKLWFNGEYCPEGTVPIRRMSKALKERAFFHHQTPINRSLVYSNQGQDFAGITTRPRQGIKYHGASAQMSVYNPKLFDNDESSSALIGIGTGDYAYSIQVGWTVDPTLYGDSQTRLVSFWGEHTNGCFNDQCAGYVHVNKRLPIDMVFPDISQIEGPQHDALLGLTLLSRIGWCLYLSETANLVGCWPNYLFYDNLASGADAVWWGGLVTSKSKVSPKMGSGQFVNGQYHKTAYMRQCKLVDPSYRTVDPDDSFIEGQDSRCYFEGDHSLSSDPFWGYKFCFGGIGGGDECIY